jgi:hypothetical protein
MPGAREPFWRGYFRWISGLAIAFVPWMLGRLVAQGGRSPVGGLQASAGSASST